MSVRPWTRFEPFEPKRLTILKLKVYFSTMRTDFNLKNTMITLK